MGVLDKPWSWAFALIKRAQGRLQDVGKVAGSQRISVQWQRCLCLLCSQCWGAHPLLWQLGLPEDSSNCQKDLLSIELKSGPTLPSRAQSPRPMPPTQPDVSGILSLPDFTSTQEGQ